VFKKKHLKEQRISLSPKPCRAGITAGRPPVVR
jgi:hypothetical protein